MWPRPFHDMFVNAMQNVMADSFGLHITQVVVSFYQNDGNEYGRLCRLGFNCATYLLTLFFKPSLMSMSKAIVRNYQNRIN